MVGPDVHGDVEEALRRGQEDAQVEQRLVRVVVSDENGQQIVRDVGHPHDEQDQHVPTRTIHLPRDHGVWRVPKGQDTLRIEIAVDENGAQQGKLEEDNVHRHANVGVVVQRAHLVRVLRVDMRRRRLPRRPRGDQHGEE